ncbi:MAG: bifunctional phosphoribosylaminoimidazolecarboxamide formyltransferase/IMP cyclohydrolase [Trueperaceae bacterium]|nr:bifunctional phosphoribosylaminoimidazolecarboxamide formyltransferase/IMP cyclohydrolase [Trueperaceae bacterium]
MKRALLSVSDKRGLVPFARGLHEAGFALVSSGGTARALHEAGLPVRRVEEVTGHPEILGGRVKTLHPAIHGGLLARDADEDRAELAAHGIAPFDLLVVNLYPFARVARDPSASTERVTETIDVGGPAMLRAAAKNWARVGVVIDPSAYDEVLEQVRAGGPDRAQRRRWARAAFAHAAAYDAAIVQWFDATDPDLPAGEHPPSLHLTLERAQTLRYGENPHQRAARYRTPEGGGFWDALITHKGRAPSWLNLLDADAAWRLAHAIGDPSAVVVKHADPCGAAVAETAHEAYARAFAADPVSAFGGVVAIRGTVDAALARAVMDAPKADVLIARGYDAEALEILRSRRKAMRVWEAPAPSPRGLDLRAVDGGYLAQTPDEAGFDQNAMQVATGRAPSEEEWRDLAVAWRVCAATSSNAIVLAKDGVALGVGAGQPNRVDAARIAATKADGRARGGAAASDAFFPFRDGLDAVAEAGVSAVIQPGGSVRDDEVTGAAEAHGITMVLSGTRRFRH